MIVYKAPIPRYLPTTPQYYGNAPMSPNPNGEVPMQTMPPAPQYYEQENRVPSSIPAYNNAPPPAPTPQQLQQQRIEEPVSKSPGGADPMRMYRYF